MKDEAMAKLKERVEQQLGITVGPNMSAHDAGKIGGMMVKMLIEEGEKEEMGDEMDEKEEM